ncbi:hypothetical protein WN48_09427 [Eufriesea mexicana]|nr:hypothetical protein WN48_09427 [Eufriesea mexicana]
MRATLLLLGGIVVFSVAVARALSCVCSPFECDILTDEDCPGGLTWDPCRYVLLLTVFAISEFPERKVCYIERWQASPNTRCIRSISKHRVEIAAMAQGAACDIPSHSSKDIQQQQLSRTWRTSNRGPESLPSKVSLSISLRQDSRTCCKVCARVEGEPCGGLFGFSGSCADGLQCVIKNLLPNTREVDEGVCTSMIHRQRACYPKYREAWSGIEGFGTEEKWLRPGLDSGTRCGPLKGEQGSLDDLDMAEGGGRKEGETQEEIPGRWRRHCPHGPIMSEPGCNLVSDGTTGENGNTLSTGRCVCGASVPWCPNEPRPYDYPTRHECKLNLAAKMSYGEISSCSSTSKLVICNVSAWHIALHRCTPTIPYAYQRRRHSDVFHAKENARKRKDFLDLVSASSTELLDYSIIRLLERLRKGKGRFVGSTASPTTSRETRGKEIEPNMSVTDDLFNSGNTAGDDVEGESLLVNFESCWQEF